MKSLGRCSCHPACVRLLMMGDTGADDLVCLQGVQGRVRWHRRQISREQIRGRMGDCRSSTGCVRRYQWKQLEAAVRLLGNGGYARALTLLFRVVGRRLAGSARERAAQSVRGAAAAVEDAPAVVVDNAVCRRRRRDRPDKAGRPARTGQKRQVGVCMGRKKGTGAF